MNPKPSILAVILCAFLTIGATLVLTDYSECSDKTLKLAYVEWSSEIASANMVQAVIQEKLGVNCVITPMTADEMWKSVAQGEQDAMVAAWLPGTHKHFYEKYKAKFVDLGPNLEGAKIGLVIPDVSPGRQTGRAGQRTRPYINIDSITQINENASKFGGRIVGIDPAAGIMKKTREALSAYNLDNMRLIEGSEVAMTAELARAIQRKEWIVVTGWKPHWMFGRWTMKFLKDPKNIFGGKEHINTIVRKGLKEDLPRVYSFLDKFSWTPDQMDQVMVWNQMQGADPYESAKRWIKYNGAQVEEWLK